MELGLEDMSKVLDGVDFSSDVIHVLETTRLMEAGGIRWETNSSTWLPRPDRLRTPVGNIAKR